MLYASNQSSLPTLRSVRASHVLVGANGGVRLSGLRSAASMMVRGRRQRHLHQLPPPDADNTNLMWLSPELLEQVLERQFERYLKSKDVNNIFTNI